MNTRIWGAAALALTTTLAACDDDDDGMTTPEVVEPTTFTVRVENVAGSYDFIDSGNFNTPDGSAMPGPSTPGTAYSFRFHGAPGDDLNFATMFVQSNDLFYAPDGQGIALYDMAGDPVSGDVTDQVYLWDAGTEADEEPGAGVNQAPRQGGPDTGGADPDNTVRLAEDTFGNLPAVDDAIRVTLTYLGGGEFMASIANLGQVEVMTSGGGSVPIVLAPGVFTVGSGADPLFTVGEPDRGEGLEALAEDGGISDLTAANAARTGVTSPLAPGVWAVHMDGEPLFSAGMSDRGQGLEALAEDGNASTLAAALASDAALSGSGAFDTPEGAAGPGPLLPGSAYTFQIEAAPGDRLSLATMFVQSNDLFYAPGAAGFALFSGQMPRSGDVTGEFLLWDAGTEVNEAPGVGAYQAPRQAGPDAGMDEAGTVRAVNDGYIYPAVERVLRVTLTPGS